MPVLFLLFVLMPITEIALLIHVGGLIGGWNTVGIVLVTAFVGAYLVRQEGLNTLQSAREKMQQQQVPAKEMIDGLMLLVAGVLLVTPGFITDIVGFLLVIPPTRALIGAVMVQQLDKRVVVQHTDYANYTSQNGQYGFRSSHDDGKTFEGEYTDTSPQDQDKRLP